MRATAGPLRFARYAYPPNQLGYCGPADSGVITEAWSAGTHEALTELAHLAPRFEGAWPYLQLIAAANGLEPLDDAVVQAYWVGNQLSAAVPPGTLARSVEERFGRRWEGPLDLVRAAAPGALAQHSYHVFFVYPWVGLLRGGRQEPALEVLDRCRVRWGTVVAVAGDRAVVRSARLRFDGWRLCLDQETTELARRAVIVAPGDVVSLHWDWICERLDAGELDWLRACTLRTLRMVNALPLPGPAMAAEVTGGPDHFEELAWEPSG